MFFGKRIPSVGEGILPSLALPQRKNKGGLKTLPYDGIYNFTGGSA